MRGANSKKVGIATEKNLQVILHRVPFNDCTNVKMPKVNTKSKQKEVTQRFQNSKYKENIQTRKGHIVQKKDTANTNETLNRSIGNNSSNSNLIIYLENNIPSQIITKDGESNVVPKQIYNVRQSTPLVKRLRKGNVKEYLEESLENSDIQNTPNESQSLKKILIYNQPIQLKTKTNLKDPYALDIIDDDDIKKHKKKKKLNDSSKFNKTMHDILKNIERKERKVKKKETSPPVYKNNIAKVLNRVLTKINQRKGCSPQKNKKEKSITKHDIFTEQTSTNKSSYIEIEDGFLGFDNGSRAQNSVHVSNITLFEDSNNRINKKHEIVDGFRGFNNMSTSSNSFVHVNPSTHSDFEIFSQSMPSTSKSTPRINILHNIHLNDQRKSSQINISHSTNNISLNNRRSEIIGSSLQRNLTSLEAHPLEKSHNLLREFHEAIPVLSDNSMDGYRTCDDEYDHVDHDFDDTCDDVSEAEDDMYFGFHEETESHPEKRFSSKRKLAPWRFLGFFKRNPHLLIIKKNGLPCLQQEMVIDYEFVKRIEALSSNKQVEPARAKSPVQTSILDFVETSRDHPEPPRPSSLFDYEEFNVAKLPRKVLGVIHDNQQIVSTPKRGVQAIVTSPNVSIIPKEGDEENSPVNNRPVQKRYQRKCPQDKEIEKDKEIMDEEILPSILDENYQEEQGEVNLFEDVEKEKSPDFSITLPTLKYERKKRRKRQISEGSDNDEEKRSKKKKKNMMTKAEEAQFEAWAALTNARFAEDDKHELFIE